MIAFTIRCNKCGDVALHTLGGGFDAAQNAFNASFDLFCRRCGIEENISNTTPKRDLLPIEADPEVREAIRQTLDG